MKHPLPWVIALAGLIPAVIFAGRVLVPDESFDTLNYHLTGSDQIGRSLFLPYRANEFFPNGIHTYAPTLEAPSLLARELLGYRLGTSISLVSLILLIWVALALGKSIAVPVSRADKALLAAAGVFVGTINEGLFQLATYMIDNLTAVLQLALVLLLCKLSDASAGKRRVCLTIATGCLAGLMCFGKMTNIGFVASCFAVFAGEQLIRRKAIPYHLIAAACVCAVVAAPYFSFLYRETGNPVAPYFAGVFASPYFEPISFAFNYGAKNWPDKLLYPIVAIRSAELLGEAQTLYPDIRLSSVFLANAAMLITWLCSRGARTDRGVLLLSALFFATYYSWALQFGLGRYAIGIEALGLILWYTLSRSLLEPRTIVGFMEILLSAGFFGYSAYRAVRHNLKYDLSWRPTLWEAPEVHRQQLPYLWSREQDVDADTKQRLASVDFILNCRAGTTGLTVLFPELHTKPMTLGKMEESHGYITRSFYAEQVDRLPQKAVLRFVTTIPQDRLKEGCLDDLPKFNMAVDSISHVPSVLGYSNTGGMSILFGHVSQADLR